MTDRHYARKLVLHPPTGYCQALDALVEEFIKDKVTFVGVVGPDCSKVEDIIDELCVGDGSNPYYMLTSAHPGQSEKDALAFANSLTGEFEGDAQFVVLSEVPHQGCF